MCIVVDRKDNCPLQDEQPKPTLCIKRKAVVLARAGVKLRRVRRTPPGSEKAACHQRGSSGTWESRSSPDEVTRKREYRVIKSPGAGVAASRTPASRSDGTRIERKRVRYHVTSDK
jgi:hypothetical protein